MGLVFKENNLQRVLDGRKTQTRRLGNNRLTVGKIYSVKRRYFDKGKAKVVLTRKFKQRLGEISLKDVRKEGFETLEEFQACWIRIYGSWDPDQVVIVYEFKLFSNGKALQKHLSQE